MIGPAAERIGRDPIAAPGARWHVDGVFAHHELAVLVFEVAPHAVQVDGVHHHRVVDQHDPQPLAVLEAQRLCIRELHAVERPGEFFHVAGQVQLKGAARLAAVRVFEGAAQVGVGEYAAPVVAQAHAGVVEFR
ncbi:hypothetical protein D3C81_634500 [compost metagenome]